MTKIVQAKDGTRWLVAVTAEWPSPDDDMRMGVKPPSYAEAMQYWHAAFIRVEQMLEKPKRVQ